MTASGLNRCYGCRVDPGQPHSEGCDHACCPDCGEQLAFHACPHWSEGAEGPGRPSIWHGASPYEEVARALNWWTTVVGIDHLVEDSTRVVFAVALGQITWDPQAQRYAIGQIDEIQINAAIIVSGM